MDQFLTAEFWNVLMDKSIEWIISEIPSIIILLLVVMISFRVIRFALNRLKDVLVKRAEKDTKTDVGEMEKRITTLLGIVRGVLKIIIWTVTIMILLQKFGVNIGPLLASAGIIGLAVGFGAQELVRDFITGFFILLENQIRVGDVAIINGTGGLVEAIELRTVTLRDFSGTVHVIQNGKINSLANMTKEWSAVVFDIGVAYKEDVDEVIKIMKQVGDDLKNDAEFSKQIIEPIEVFGLDQFGDSALVIKARLKTKPIQQWAVGREFRKRLKKAFDDQNIEIPFPHQTIYWGEEIHPLKISTKTNEN
ncbi:MAG: mechanosensitive ion channel [Caldithrix sp.]|nr:mechanosensitive ion channel [Caldithrix sp.]